MVGNHEHSSKLGGRPGGGLEPAAGLFRMQRLDGLAELLRLRPALQDADLEERVLDEKLRRASGARGGQSVIDSMQRRIEGRGKSVPLFRSKKMLFYPIFGANSKHMDVFHAKLPLVWS